MTLVQAIQSGGDNLVVWAHVCVATYVQRCFQYKGTSNKLTLGIRMLLQQIRQDGQRRRLIETNDLASLPMSWGGCYIVWL